MSSIEVEKKNKLNKKIFEIHKKRFPKMESENLKYNGEVVENYAISYVSEEKLKLLDTRKKLLNILSYINDNNQILINDESL